jgi:hypothetical protein
LNNLKVQNIFPNTLIEMLHNALTHHTMKSTSLFFYPSRYGQEKEGRHEEEEDREGQGHEKEGHEEEEEQALSASRQRDT